MISIDGKRKGVTSRTPENLLGDDVLYANETSCGLITVVDHALPEVFVDVAAVMVRNDLPGHVMPTVLRPVRRSRDWFHIRCDTDE